MLAPLSLLFLALSAHAEDLSLATVEAPSDLFPEASAELPSPALLETGAQPLRYAVYYVFSDNTNQATPLGSVSSAAMQITAPSAWTASIPGASWIWTSESNTDVLFSKWVSVPTNLASAVLTIAAKDSVQFFINGKDVVCSNYGGSYLIYTQFKCDITQYMITGVNSLKFYVVNNNSGAPAGLLYQLMIKLQF
jgi:hypothetical protein